MELSGFRTHTGGDHGASDPWHPHDHTEPGVLWYFGECELVVCIGSHDLLSVSQRFRDLVQQLDVYERERCGRCLHGEGG